MKTTAAGVTFILVAEQAPSYRFVPLLGPDIFFTLCYLVLVERGVIRSSLLTISSECRSAGKPRSNVAAIADTSDNLEMDVNGHY
ncbi:hypothetical protein VTP01DRAFT_4301 [Rhizomucor pusillus]|uniref:uncharacterized protein n=1 Tax=Rhizomucor pusillus TaxID=4840 RepID=UPI0037444EA3